MPVALLAALSQGGALSTTCAVMPYGMYISAEGAQAQIKRLEVVSNNLANVNTAGFKRDVASFQARFAEAIERGMVGVGEGAREDVGGGVQLYDIQTVYEPGAVETTGRPTDMTIVGDGFFQVRTPQGVYLTRAGNFTRGASGELETQQGFKVLNEQGRPIPLPADWQLTEDGAIESLDFGKNFLALVRPQSLDQLSKVGDNLFAVAGRARNIPAAERNVRGGVLEKSDVNSTSSMLEMIETTRAVDANMNLIKNQDQMLNTLISRILKG